MNKGKKSIFNAITALFQMFVTSIVGLVLNKTIIITFGSDYNGINSAITQIINTLMILEGGFSLASNVALFDPFGKKEYDSVNAILSATKIRFLKVGKIAILVGLIITAVYPFTVTSSMPKVQIAIVMLTALIPVCCNLSFNMKYRVLLLTDQKEYIISLVTALMYVLGNCIAIIALYFGASLIMVRVIIMMSLLLNYWMIQAYCKKTYSFAKYNSMPDFDSIKGTKSVIVLKVMTVVYNAIPIIAISTIPENGALLASVYAVYRSVIALVRDSMTAVTNAPRLAFGALFSEGNDNEIKGLFNIYEMIACIGISIIVGTTCLLLIPFVELYTKGINDVQYKDILLAIIMLATVILEILHIPSGQIIQMKGEFEVSKKIQSVACVLLVLSMFIGRIVAGLYGIVAAVLIAAIALAIMEIGYTSLKLIRRTTIGVLKNMLPCVTICGITMIIGLNDVLVITSYCGFFVAGIVAVTILTAITMSVYYCIDKAAFKAIIKLFQRTLSKKDIV